MNCPSTELLTKKSTQCIIDEKTRREKNEKHSLAASVFVFSSSCLAHGIKILGLGIVQMLEKKDFSNSLCLRVDQANDLDYLLFGNGLEGKLTLCFNNIFFLFNSMWLVATNTTLMLLRIERTYKSSLLQRSHLDPPVLEILQKIKAALEPGFWLQKLKRNPIRY